MLRIIIPSMLTHYIHYMLRHESVPSTPRACTTGSKWDHNWKIAIAHIHIKIIQPHPRSNVLSVHQIIKSLCHSVLETISNLSAHGFICHVPREKLLVAPPVPRFLMWTIPNITRHGWYVATFHNWSLMSLALPESLWHYDTMMTLWWHYDILFPGNIPCIMTIYYNSFYMHNT